MIDPRPVPAMVGWGPIRARNVSAEIFARADPTLRLPRASCGWKVGR